MASHSIEIEYCYSIMVLKQLLLFKFFFPLSRIRELIWKETWYFVMKSFQAKLPDPLEFLEKGFILCQLLDLETQSWNCWQLVFPFHYWLEFSFSRFLKRCFCSSVFSSRRSQKLFNQQEIRSWVVFFFFNGADKRLGGGFPGCSESSVLPWIYWMEPWILGAPAGSGARAGGSGSPGGAAPPSPDPGERPAAPAWKSSWSNREKKLEQLGKQFLPHHQSHSRLLTSTPFTAQLWTTGGLRFYAFYFWTQNWE